jgi:hypothetical protein
MHQYLHTLLLQMQFGGWCCCTRCSHRAGTDSIIHVLCCCSNAEKTAHRATLRVYTQTFELKTPAAMRLQNQRELEATLKRSKRVFMSCIANDQSPVDGGLSTGSHSASDNFHNTQHRFMYDHR